MKPSEIIKLARRQTGCTEDIVTREEAYRFLNFVIEDFGADIRNSDSWYGFDILNINVTSGQSTYPFTNTDWDLSNAFPIHKIQAVFIKNKEDKWVDLPVHFVDKVNPNKRESIKEPLACFITRDSVNLIPTPKESTQMQIWWFNYNKEIYPEMQIVISGGTYTKTYGRKSEWDVAWADHPYAWQEEWTSTYRYTTSEVPAEWDYLYDEANDADVTFSYPIVQIIDNDTEEMIFIDKRWHYVIVEWMKYWMYWNMWVNFETARGNSRAFFDSEKNKAIQNIMDRWQLADTAYLPNLNFLNY